MSEGTLSRVSRQQHICLLFICLSSYELFLLIYFTPKESDLGSLETFPLIRNKARLPLLTATIQHCVGGLKLMPADKQN